MRPTEPTHPPTDPPSLGEFGGHPIYPMPAFVRLETPDVARLVAFFTEILDFGIVFVGPEMHGEPILVHLRRAKYQDVLVAPQALAIFERDASLGVCFGAGEADEVDALGARIADRAPAALDGPVDTPWNTRDVTVTDPDGHRWTFTGRGRQPMRGSIDAAMEETVERLQGR
jgi:catechol 2,3-dioxygenase-like lactoylglutathione lyase family enzyme